MKILIFLKGGKDILICSSRKGELYNCNRKLRNVFLAAYLCGRYYFGRFQVSKQSNFMNIFQGDRFLLDWYTCWFKKTHTCARCHGDYSKWNKQLHELGLAHFDCRFFLYVRAGILIKKPVLDNKFLGIF